VRTKGSSNRLLTHGTLFAWCRSSETGGGGQIPMKSYFLLMIMSVFVGLSFIPIRGEAKQTNPSRARIRNNVMPNG
jgi:hypothetical protein